MQSILTHRNHFAQPAADGAAQGGVLAQGGNALRRWLGDATRAWRQRKMIAALNALDDRTLLDMGIFRADIPRLVEGFDERELQMVPLAPPRPVQQIAYYPNAA